MVLRIPIDKMVAPLRTPILQMEFRRFSDLREVSGRGASDRGPVRGGVHKSDDGRQLLPVLATLGQRPFAGQPGNRGTWLRVHLRLRS